MTSSLVMSDYPITSSSDFSLTSSDFPLVDSTEVSDIPEVSLVDTKDTSENTKSTRKHSIKTVLPELETYNLPTDIKDRANFIYSQLKSQTRRGKRRVQMIFFCIYIAHGELNKMVAPAIIADMVGLKKTEINKAFSMFSEVQTGYKPKTSPDPVRDPINMIPDLCVRLGFEQDDIQKCLSLAEEIMKKDTVCEVKERLSLSPPQVVASGIIQYYLMINGINIDRKGFSKITKSSDNSIKTIQDKISHLHNN